MAGLAFGPPGVVMSSAALGHQAPSPCSRQTRLEGRTAGSAVRGCLTAANGEIGLGESAVTPAVILSR
jgi:hypothetical protein